MYTCHKDSHTYEYISYDAEHSTIRSTRRYVRTMCSSSTSVTGCGSLYIITRYPRVHTWNQAQDICRTYNQVAMILRTYLEPGYKVYRIQIKLPRGKRADRQSIMKWFYHIACIQPGRQASFYSHSTYVSTHRDQHVPRHSRVQLRLGLEVRRRNGSVEISRAHLWPAHDHSFLLQNLREIVELHHR